MWPATSRKQRNSTAATPRGTRLIFNGDIYDEWQGVVNHFINRMANAEEDLTGRLYLHDMVSPLIEVAEDGKTADCMFSSHGCETRMESGRDPESLLGF